MTRTRPPRPPAAAHARVAVVLGAVVLVWRVLATRRGADPGWFVLWWAVEAFGVLRLWHELRLVGGPPPAARDDHAAAPCGSGEAEAVVVLVVHDEPVRVARAAILAARAQDGVASVVVLDLGGRGAIAEICERVGADHRAVAAAALAQTARASIASAPDATVCIVSPEHVLLPGAVRALCARLDASGAAAVVGAVDTVNARRRIDGPGLGHDDDWETEIAPRLGARGALWWWEGAAVFERARLDAAGGPRSATPSDLAASAVAVRAAGGSVVHDAQPATQVLAPATVRIARHRRARRLHGRRAAAAQRRASSPAVLDPVERASVRLPWFATARVAARLGLVALLVATAVGGARPVGGPGGPVLVATFVRCASSAAARLAARRRGFVPWILDDLRTIGQDLVLAAVPAAARPPARGARAWGDGPARGLPRVLSALVASAVAATVTGFVHVADGRLALIAVGTALAFLGAANAARRELRRLQFRQWWRADTDLVADVDEPVRVVGLSPFGFDIERARPVEVGEVVRFVLALPALDGGTSWIIVTATARRTGSVGGLAVAYVTAETLDPAVEDGLLLLLTGLTARTTAGWGVARSGEMTTERSIRGSSAPIASR